jgi:hypothetical protein
MADKKSPRTPLVLSPETLFRYQVVSAVKARELSGQGTDAAVREVAAQRHVTVTGEPKTCAVRSIYRWLAELDRAGPSGIETARPEARDLDGAAGVAARLPREGEGRGSLRVGPRADPAGPRARRDRPAPAR